jgi:hypothetical protein
MDTHKSVEAETSHRLTEAQQTNVEYLILGGDSIQGIIRFIVFIALYIVLFGTLFSVVQS